MTTMSEDVAASMKELMPDVSWPELRAAFRCSRTIPTPPAGPNSGGTVPEKSDELDLGHGVTAVWTSRGEHDRAGLIESHPCTGGNCRERDGDAPGRCSGSILFDLPGIAEAFPGKDQWTVEQWEPLTLSPSVACGCRGCGHHGWIRDGRWVPA